MPRLSAGLFLVAAGAGAAALAGVSRPAAVAHPPAGAAAAASTPPLLGIVYQPSTSRQPMGRLVRVDAQTLQPLPGTRLDVGAGGCAPRSGGEACWTVPPWSFSPDRSLLAIARNERSSAHSVRIVDTRRLRVTADVRLAGGAVGGLAWLGRGSVLALQEVCCAERQRLLAIDLASRRVARRSLSGSVVRVGRTNAELVLLLAPARSIGPARIAVADSRGRLRVALLARMLAGTKLRRRGSGHGVTLRLPGLAVDARRRRAFVVDAGLIAEVDLRSLRVSYHELERTRAPSAHARDRVEPGASTKGASGPIRSATWLGRGILAVSGADEAPFTDAQGQEQTRIRPVGLLIVDTRDWSVDVVDRGATDLVAAGELVLATGWSWDSSTQRVSAIGLAAYTSTGEKRFQLFDGEQAWVARVYGGFAYVGISHLDGRLEPLRVVDLGQGVVVAHRRRPLPTLLLGAGSGWWSR